MARLSLTLAAALLLATVPAVVGFGSSGSSGYHRIEAASTHLPVESCRDISDDTYGDPAGNCASYGYTVACTSCYGLQAYYVKQAGTCTQATTGCYFKADGESCTGISQCGAMSTPTTACELDTGYPSLYASLCSSLSAASCHIAPQCTGGDSAPTPTGGLLVTAQEVTPTTGYHRIEAAGGRLRVQSCRDISDDTYGDPAGSCASYGYTVACTSCYGLQAYFVAQAGTCTQATTGCYFKADGESCIGISQCPY